MNALEEKMITPIKPESGKRWFAVFMVSLAITINYLDRVNFSVATPTMMEYFGLTAGQMGVLMSAFPASLADGGFPFVFTGTVRHQVIAC
jgi:sugar phosphate permease